MRAARLGARRSLKSGKRRGMAMLMALIAVSLMTVLVANFMENTAVFVATGTNARDEIQATYMARSAINLSRLLLVMQPMINRTLRGFGMPALPIWRYADVMLAAFSDPGTAGGLGMMFGADMEESEGFGVDGGDFSAQIVDEDSRININMAAQGRLQDLLARQLSALVAPAKYNDLFEERDSEGDFTDREIQIQAIIDWADLDMVPFGFDSGSEDSTYELYDPRYHRRNAPYDSLEELRMVRGVDEDFWDAFVEPNPSDPEQRILTVWGTGRININTASPLVIAALICAYAQNNPEPACDPTSPVPGALMLAQFVDMYRSAGGLLPGLGGFARTRDFTQLVSEGATDFIPGFSITGVPLNTREAERYLDVESRVFSIYAVGEVGRVTKTIHVVIHTGMLPNEGGAVLYWRED